MILNLLVTSLLSTCSVSLHQPGADAFNDCRHQSTSAEALNKVFAGGIGNVLGADYQRAFSLNDGRTLWVFQDAFIDDGDAQPTLVHNVGALQEGMCFVSLTTGHRTRPTSWVADKQTHRFHKWYWPLSGYQKNDEMFVLYMAEMIEAGSSYLEKPTPTSAVSVEIDLNTMTAGDLSRAPSQSTNLYGFSTTDDDEYRYLYGQCHRQFGFSDFGHDRCTRFVYVARQPLNNPKMPLEYWDGNRWTRNSRKAVNIAPLHAPNGDLRGANPMQIARDGERWIAVTKADDWWGDLVYFDIAPRPEGPWTTTAVLPVATRGDPGEVSSYFVSFIPTDQLARTIAISNNRWDGQMSEDYRPTFTSIGPYIWGHRQAQMVTQHLWLPFGPKINLVTKSQHEPASVRRH